jgi:hypothetical protein
MRSKLSDIVKALVPSKLPETVFGRWWKEENDTRVVNVRIRPNWLKQRAQGEAVTCPNLAADLL